MGYERDWTLKLSKKLPVNEVIKTLDDITNDCWDEYEGEYTLHSTKWYDFEKDIHVISAHYLDITVTVSSIGEDHRKFPKRKWLNGQEIFTDKKSIKSIERQIQSIVNKINKYKTLGKDPNYLILSDRDYGFLKAYYDTQPVNLYYTGSIVYMFGLKVITVNQKISPLVGSDK